MPWRASLWSTAPELSHSSAGLQWIALLGHGRMKPSHSSETCVRARVLWTCHYSKCCTWHTVTNIRLHFQSLVTFVNKHLNKVNLEVSDLDTQFHDGVYLTLLMGLLEGFFVPLYSFHLTPQDFDQKVHNVSFAFDLMQDVGLAKPKARPEGKL